MSAEVVHAAGHQSPNPVATEPDVPVVRMPVEACGLALSILAVIAVALALEWAQAFFISLLLGILIAYTLNPPVAWLERTVLRGPLPAAHQPGRRDGDDAKRGDGSESDGIDERRRIA